MLARLRNFPYFRKSQQINPYVRYRQSENEVYLIDSGNDKEAAKKALKIAGQNGWRIKDIINTHSNADHIKWFYFRKMGTNIGDMSTFPPFMLPYLCGQ